MNKLRLILLALVPALVLMVSACADDEGNTGSPIDRCIGEYVYNMTGYDNNSGVWEIYNENGLNNFRDNVTTDGNVNINAKLVCDIELTNKADNISWIPIGKISNIYNGTFDGDNYTINGLYIDNSTADYQGLFGVIGSNATIKNLIVKDVEITAKIVIGAVIGENEGNIINVHVDNVIIVGNDYIGAITGTNEGSGNIYASSASNIDIEATATDAYIGGIVSYNESNIAATYLDNARITADGNSAILGGIVGYNERGEIVSSYTNDLEFVHDVNNRDVGGIVGISISVSLSSNYFVSDNTTLFGVGIEYDVATNTEKEVTEAVDNATRVETIQALNDNVTVINGAIDIWVGDGVDREFGYRYDVLIAPDNATKIPTLISK